jgi:hypothetical protein
MLSVTTTAGVTTIPPLMAADTYDGKVIGGVNETDGKISLTRFATVNDGVKVVSSINEQLDERDNGNVKVDAGVNGDTSVLTNSASIFALNLSSLSHFLLLIAGSLTINENGNGVTGIVVGTIDPAKSDVCKVDANAGTSTEIKNAKNCENVASGVVTVLRPRALKIPRIVLNPLNKVAKVLEEPAQLINRASKSRNNKPAISERTVSLSWATTPSNDKVCDKRPSKRARHFSDLTQILLTSGFDEVIVSGIAPTIGKPEMVKIGVGEIGTTGTDSGTPTTIAPFTHAALNIALVKTPETKPLIRKLKVGFSQVPPTVNAIPGKVIELIVVNNGKVIAVVEAPKIGTTGLFASTFVTKGNSGHSFSFRSFFLCSFLTTTDEQEDSSTGFGLREDLCSDIFAFVFFLFTVFLFFFFFFLKKFFFQSKKSFLLNFNKQILQLTNFIQEKKTKIICR